MARWAVHPEGAEPARAARALVEQVEHVKRLQEAVQKLDRFVDPIVIISPEPDVYWTPNGNHRSRSRLPTRSPSSTPAGSRARE